MRFLDTIYVDGAWRKASGPARLSVVNPATDEPIVELACADRTDVDAAVGAAAHALEGWRTVPAAERGAAIARIAKGIAERSEELAAAVTAEMGSPIGFSRTAQIGLPQRDIATTLEALDVLKDEAIGASLVLREPVGVVVAITPWNFPLHQIAAKIAPALAAGCTVVLKPSEISPTSAQLLAEIVDATGLPAGVFNLVHGAGETGALLAGHPAVDMISFTGSTRAGLDVAARAAKDLKRVSLELGGKSANVVLDDADFAKAIPAALGQCFINSGQVCAALSRLLVPARRLREVEELAVAAAAGWTLGDPQDPQTRLGPVASRAQQMRVRRHIEGAERDGARLLVGGAAQPAGFNHGCYVAPTIFSDVTNAMTIGREEVFGPVLSIMTYDDVEDAVRKANDSDYGLSGGVWSADAERAGAVARRLRTGQVVVNGAMLDVAAPFGGVKKSGLGRECGRFGIEEFTVVKTVSGLAAAG